MCQAPSWALGLQCLGLMTSAFKVLVPSYSRRSFESVSEEWISHAAASQGTALQNSKWGNKIQIKNCPKIILTGKMY